MKIVYKMEELPQSAEKTLFLAELTPEPTGIPSWGGEALRILIERKFKGYVLVPKTRNESWGENSDDHSKWETKGLELATVISLWIPEGLKNMPIKSADIKYGAWLNSGKVVMGAPVDAPKMDFLKHQAKKLGIPQALTLEDTLDIALKMIEEKK